MTEFDIKHFCRFVCENRQITDRNFISEMIEQAPRDLKDNFLKYVEMKLHEKNH